MAYIKATVYDPPDEGLPFLAVLLGPDGSLAGARAFASAEEADAYLAQIMPDLSAEIQHQKQKR